MKKIEHLEDKVISLESRTRGYEEQIDMYLGLATTTRKSLKQKKLKKIEKPIILENPSTPTKPSKSTQRKCSNFSELLAKFQMKTPNSIYESL